MWHLWEAWRPAVLGFTAFLGCMAVVWLTMAGVTQLECRRHAQRRTTGPTRQSAQPEVGA